MSVYFMHPISFRIKTIIEIEYGGDIVEFTNRLDNVSVNSISRLFKKNKQTGKYPIPSTSLILEILDKFINYNTRWVMLGWGDPINNDDELSDIIEATFEEQFKILGNNYWKEKYYEIASELKDITDKYTKLLENRLIEAETKLKSNSN